MHADKLSFEIDIRHKPSNRLTKGCSQGSVVYVNMAPAEWQLPFYMSCCKQVFIPFMLEFIVLLQAIPGGRMLVTADETGVTAGVDLRMIGGKDGKKAVLWQSRNPTGGITCLAVASRPSDGRNVILSVQCSYPKSLSVRLGARYIFLLPLGQMKPFALATIKHCAHKSSFLFFVSLASTKAEIAEDIRWTPYDPKGFCHLDIFPKGRPRFQ